MFPSQFSPIRKRNYKFNEEIKQFCNERARDALPHGYLIKWFLTTHYARATWTLLFNNSHARNVYWKP